MSLSNLFLLLSAVQGFILMLIIIFSPFFKSRGNNYLGYSIGILSLLIFNLFLDNTGVFDTYPKLSIITTIEWVFLFSTFFLYFVLNHTNHNLLKNKQVKWLYLPILLSIVIHLVIHLEYIFNLYKITFEGKVFLYDIVVGIEELFTYIYAIILMTWARVIIQKTSRDSTLNVRWLKKLWFFIFVILVSWILLFIIDIIVYEYNLPFKLYVHIHQYVFDIELSLLVYWIAYTGLYKLRIASKRQEILNVLNNEFLKIENPQIENHELTVSNDFSKNNPYFLKLEELLQKQFIYRDPNLSQDTVAEKLGISSGYLSQIINNVTQKKFTSYINSYRVKETQRMVLDKEFEKYNILSIGLESGFNSKTTFYSAFKKETGCTPSEYRNRYK